MTETIIVKPLALTLHWANDLITRIDLSDSNDRSESSDCSEQAALLRVALADYVSGTFSKWPELPLDLSNLTPFQHDVLTALTHLPYGTTCSYGELAHAAGHPGSARAIGGVMAANPFPLIYPCHRVIGSSGKLTGFSANGGVSLKAKLLQHEAPLGSPFT